MVEIPGKTLTLNVKYCKACYLCVNICPKKVFDISKEPAETGLYVPVIARREDCIDYERRKRGEDGLCNLCVLMCPDQALSWEESE